MIGKAPVVKIVYRHYQAKELEEVVAPEPLAKELISKHAGISISPDAGKTWIVFGGGDWNYYYIVGTFVAEEKRLPQNQVAPKAVQPLQLVPNRAANPLMPVSASAPAPMTESERARRISDKFSMRLVCQRSGLALGDFLPLSGLAVATPYVVAWKETTFLHPIFSLSIGALISRAQACWNLEKTGTRQFPMQHKQLLFLAMLHASDCIKQSVPGLPSAKIVETHFARLIELLGWRHDTASTRVSFPKLHVWRGAAAEDNGNIFANVSAWLDVVEACKEEYENIARSRQKAAKAKAQELAMKSIRRSMYADVSVKRLWNWFKTQVPQMVMENNPDIEQLFFAEEDRIAAWTEEDIDAAETLFLRYCETGNSVSHEVQKHLNKLRGWLALYNDTFEFVDTSNQFADHKGQPEPTMSMFVSKAEYYVAHAKWKLGNKEVPAAVQEKTNKPTVEDL